MQSGRCTQIGNLADGTTCFPVDRSISRRGWGDNASAADIHFDPASHTSPVTNVVWSFPTKSISRVFFSSLSRLLLLSRLVAVHPPLAPGGPVLPLLPLMPADPPLPSATNPGGRAWNTDAGFTRAPGPTSRVHSLVT